MPANVLAEDVGEIIDRRLAAASARLLLINPDEDAIRRLVETLSARDDPPQVSLLAAEELLKEVTDDFRVASRAADLVESDHLELRRTDEPPNQCVLVTDSDVTALVAVADGVSALEASDGDVVAAANDHFEDVLADAEPYTLRTPPLSRVRETLEADVGPETAADFDAVLASIGRVREGEEPLDEVTISLLVAARNGELLYDVSKWGEDVGLASKATFSRTKTTLEDAGVIATEKVPIQVGRPRLRLLLGDDRLADAAPGEMAAIARQLLPE